MLAFLSALLVLSYGALRCAAKATLPDPLFVAYWGQNTAETSLLSYCQLGYYNVINLAFVSNYGDIAFAFQTGEGCSATATESSGCTTLASEITSCQALGVKILVSFGGGTKYDCAPDCTGDYQFGSDEVAMATATQVWRMFFNGGTTTEGVARPFGNVVLDGIDLDVEMLSKMNGQNPQAHYDTFVNQLLAYNPALIIGAAPECQWGTLGENPLEGVIGIASIDFFFVQAFNNAKCSFRTTGFTATFEHWVSVAASNPNGATHVLLGLPGDTAAAIATSYWLSSAETVAAVTSLRATYPSAQVGVGVWDAASAYGSSASDSEPQWAATVHAGLAAMPAAAVAVASTAAAAAVAGNATLSVLGATAAVVANATAAETAAVAGATSAGELPSIPTGLSSAAAASASNTTTTSGGAAGRRTEDTIALGAIGVVAALVGGLM